MVVNNAVPYMSTVFSFGSKTSKEGSNNEKKENA